LLGRDPVTGENLVGTSGNAIRADASRKTSRRDPIPETGTVSLKAAAQHLGVDRTYLQRLVKATAEARANGEDIPEKYLDASRTSPRGRWQINAAELQRFAAARDGQSVVLGYDVTFSCPKSVSLLWAMGDREMRTEILNAIESSVGAGIGYLEANGCTVKVGGELVVGEGLLAAGFLHATSRALDPQLHWHCVVLNATVAPDGTPRAIDGRGLFAHAKSAGYLAGAQLRHELTERLGVAWDDPHNGLADITGIDRDTIEAFSKRSQEIGEVADAAGLSSASARQAAALASRSAKQGVLAEDLIDGWHQELADRGYTQERIDTIVDQKPAQSSPLEQDQRRLVAELLSAHGITELSAVFDRRDVLQRISEWAGNRLTAAEITDLADEFLCHPEVVRLDSSRPGAVIRRADGRTVTAGTGATYSTVTMLSLEREITERFCAGFDQDAAKVDGDVLQSAIDHQPALGQDQEDMVRTICTSGDRVQLVLGPAGSGKTFALEVAARAWEANGQRVIGTAVAGVAAEVLANSVGVQTTTVASLLTRLDTNGPEDVLDANTVVLVDEASTLGTRDLAGLVRWADTTGATLRLVGDPAQHSAVAAGGMFRHLLGEHPDRVPVLTENRRQVGDGMAEVRLALADYRTGQIAKAIERLDNDQRIVTADSADELLDTLVSDWYVDRQTRADDPDRSESSMIAEHHFERRELNNRARTLLAADGTLTGPVLDAGEQSFQAGDTVIARAQDRSLRPEGGGRGSHVRNGTRGTVLEVRAEPGHDGLFVDFDRKGQVFVPRSFLENEVRRGVVGGLTHAYALTSHAAQGETYEAGRHLATDRSGAEGVYVGLSRGRTDVKLYAVRHHDLSPKIDDDPGLPRLDRETADTRKAVADRLTSIGSELLATEHDRFGLDAIELRHLDPPTLYRLAEESGSDSVEQRAWDNRRAEIATTGWLDPTEDVLDALGSRPEPGAARLRWDRAAGAIAVHQAIHPDSHTPDATASWSSIDTLVRAASDRTDLRTEAENVPPVVDAVVLEDMPEDVLLPAQPLAPAPVMEIEL
jgi:conjugative relaxase-like TrwC/TraI family protein